MSEKRKEATMKRTLLIILLPSYRNYRVQAYLVAIIEFKRFLGECYTYRNVVCGACSLSCLSDCAPDRIRPSASARLASHSYSPIRTRKSPDVEHRFGNSIP